MRNIPHALCRIMWYNVDNKKERMVDYHETKYNKETLAERLGNGSCTGYGSVCIRTNACTRGREDDAESGKPEERGKAFRFQTETPCEKEHAAPGEVQWEGCDDKSEI